MSKKLMRKKLALMLANLKKKRKYYCEVEYLQSTGTQYIDIGLNGKNGYDFDYKFNSTLIDGTAYGIGGELESGNSCYLGLIRNTNKFAYHYQNTQSPIEVQTLVANTDYRVQAHLYSGEQYYIINGTKSAVGTITGTFTSTTSMSLFRVNSSSPIYSYIKVYFCKIWDNGVLVRDFIPVLDWDYVPCMYDKVTGQLFYNQGTGNFTAGREVHPVDYLESTETQYIDTGYIPTNTTGVQVRHTICADNSKDNIVFGCRENSKNTRFWEDVDWSQADNIGWGFNEYSNNLSGYRYPLTSDMIGQTIVSSFNFMNDRACKVDGVSYDPSIATKTLATITKPIYLFAANNQGNAGYFNACKIFKAQISEGSTLVRDFIPCIDENGVGFMFDRVTHTIFDNAGTGAFKYPAREVEYLESDGAIAIVAGVTVDDTCGYDVKWMALNSNDTIILGTKGSGDSRWVLSGGNNPNVNLSWNTSYSSSGLGLNKIQTARMNYLNDRKRILNDRQVTNISETLSPDASTYNVGIFAGYWGASTISLYSTCRIYYAKISKGTELIRDFIPMIKDGSPCLYDKVGGEYYFGIGTGSFSKGKIVEPEYE